MKRFRILTAHYILYILLTGGALAGVLFLHRGSPRASTVSTTAPPSSSMQTTKEGVLIGAREPVQVTIADSGQERELGLSNTPLLTPYTGAFFMFDTPDKYGFWMKDMQYAIDIVWIDATWKVIAVSPNITPDTYPTVVYPPLSVQYVLEVNAYDADALGILPGTVFSLRRH